jgi:hypothetical protein
MNFFYEGLKTAASKDVKFSDEVYRKEKLTDKQGNNR